VNNRAHPAVAQQVHVVDAVRASDHPSHQRSDLDRRIHPGRPGHRHGLGDQVHQPGPISQRDHRSEPGTGH
jgi:hypothetical protein